MPQKNNPRNRKNPKNRILFLRKAEKEQLCTGKTALFLLFGISISRYFGEVIS
jgi:hypothetical protein